MKIHYTIYDVNYNKGENTRPICNDNTRMWNHQLTQDVREITCKKCMKSKIKYHKLSIEMHKDRGLFDAEYVDRMHKEIRILEEKLKK